MESSSNSKQALWMAIGQFFTFAIGIISPMILSRYFTIEDYGTYKQVMYVYNTLLVVFSLGLPRAYSYFIPRVSVPESKDVVRKMTSIFTCLGVLFSLVLFLCSGFIANVLNNEELSLALKLFSPTPLFLFPVIGLEGILASYKKTQYFAIYSIVSKLLSLCCIVAPVLLFEGSYFHAIIGFDIASFFSFLFALYVKNIPTRGVELQKTDVSYEKIFRFSIPLMTSSLWIMIYQSASQYFISRYYGAKAFASFSNGFMEFPVTQMVINSVATVLTPLFSGMALNNVSGISETWKNAIYKTVKIIYPVSIYCIFMSPIVMTCLYGSQYEDSAIYFSIKNIESLFTILPFYSILFALGKTKEYSRIHMIMAFAIVLLEYICVWFGGSPYAIALVYLFCAITKILLQFLLVGHCLGMKFRQLIPFHFIIKSGWVAFLSIIVPVLLMIKYYSYSSWLLLFSSICIYIVCYYILCWIFKLSYKDIITSYVNKEKFSLIYKIIP